MSAPTETEVKLARALLAWKRLADRGFGPPEKWEAYEWHGFKLDMAGHEEWFDDLFEAEAVKKACMAADGLPEAVLTALRKPDEDIPFGEEEIDLRGCQVFDP
jgi:hypothetical protein